MGRRRIITSVSAFFVVTAVCAGAFWVAAGSASSDLGEESLASTSSPVTVQLVADHADQREPVADDMHPITRRRYRWVQERADWVGGAVVHCDLGTSLSGRMLKLDESAAITGDSAVDVPMRHGGKWPLALGREDAHFVVTQDAGRAVARLVPSPFDGQPAGDEQLFVVRWSGARPGTTVPCDSVHRASTGQVRVRVVEADGTPYVGSSLGWHDGLVRVRGCGIWRRAARLAVDVPVTAGACTMQAEVRGDVPFATALGPPVTIYVGAGERVEVVLTLPDDPQLTAAPNVEELTEVVDFLLFEGEEALADLGERAIDATLDGYWDARLATEVADAVQALMDDLSPDDG
jgi:hypothetical protein